MKKKKIAIIGFECRYPDAQNASQFWETMVARRRAFRSMPEKRLNASYFSSEAGAKDHIYTNKVAVLTNYVFDRNRFNISKKNFLTADLTHWLALDVVSAALGNAGITNLPDDIRKYTGVIVGNTLTGEFSRSNVLRLRWPYISSAISNALETEGWSPSKISGFLSALEEKYKSPFTPMEEDSLAGGLSNTIAGRLCNYFDFKGGGYTIDGACSSSLLAVCKACDAISNDELLVAVAGGVDLSLDPFELVGFSRAGALAKKEMLVYDRDSHGFWPGEGCGFVILADYEFARKNELHISATITGWGISSDGKGGLTRPTVEGQQLALERAYQKAGYGINTLSYLEGHGTGTSVGDATELSAIIKEISKDRNGSPLFIGSVKSNIGHTKAAAGVAGLIKCLLILKNRKIPPATGVRTQNTLLNNMPYLRLPYHTVNYTAEPPMRAGVSSMGFGGINTHITMEEEIENIKSEKPVSEKLETSYQDTELFLFAEKDSRALSEKLTALLEKVKSISYAELSDLSCSLYQVLKDLDYRMAIVADTPEQLYDRIKKAIEYIEIPGKTIIDDSNGIYFSENKVPWKIGLLFPGQGIEALSDDGLLMERFPFIRSFIRELPYPEKGSVFNTGNLQPALVKTSVMAIKFIQMMGITAEVAVGHSLGELSALYWAGALNEGDVIALAKARGRLMQENKNVKGKMLSVALNYNNPFIDVWKKDFDVSIACINSASQVVFSGATQNIDKLYAFCKDTKIAAAYLQVENAFHSHLMKALEKPFSQCLDITDIKPPEKKVYSTVSSEIIAGKKDISSNLVNQLTHPVLFEPAFIKAAKEADYWIEAGGGDNLHRLVNSIPGIRSCSLNFTGNTIRGILRIAGTMFVTGNPINLDMLFSNRFYRKWEEELHFIENPCEQREGRREEKIESPDENNTTYKTLKPAGIDIASLFKTELANKIDLPPAQIIQKAKMLDDFHLNSLFVGQLLAEFAEKYKLSMTDTPSEYANASVDDIIKMFTECQETEQGNEKKESLYEIEGIRSWVFPYTIKYKYDPLPKREMKLNVKESVNIVLGDCPGHLIEITHKEFNNIPALFLFLYGSDAKILEHLRDFLQCYRDPAKNNRFVFIQDRPVSTAFAKSLYLENQEASVTVIEIEQAELSEQIIWNELSQSNGFCFAKYKDNKRYTPELQPVSSPLSNINVMPCRQDNILVTGGGKGITFECARKLAKVSGCRLILTGRSSPENDINLYENLEILRNQAIDFTYYVADVSKVTEIEKVIKQEYEGSHRISGIIHGAGINLPGTVSSLEYDQLLEVLAPKLYGLRNIFLKADLGQLKFCITFGSIIAEAGMEGNADYALANEWLRNEVQALSKKLSHIYFLNMEWSVWGGTGMGQKLGVLELLKKRGIHPITLDEGIRQFLNIFKERYPDPNIIITGRHGQMPTLNKKNRDIPIQYRFIENIRIHYPGIELIADCTLSEDTDIYLHDHKPGGHMVFPGVFGLEAMAEAVMVLNGQSAASVIFKDVCFNEPVIIQPGKKKTIRIIAQRENANSFIVVIREESTAFKKDHFKAHLSIPVETEIKNVPEHEKRNDNSLPHNVDSLYGSLLFHTGIFRKIEKFTCLEPYRCKAVAGITPSERYFSDFLPQHFVLGNPGLNDAVLHAVQACIPNYRLLPAAIDTVQFDLENQNTEIVINAREIKQVKDEYIYAITVSDRDGKVKSVWGNVKFKILKERATHKLTPFFIGIILQRKVDELYGHKNVLYSIGNETRLGIIKRSDGKPELLNGNKVSKTYNEGNAIITTSEAECAIDVENVMEYSLDHWIKLLGSQKANLIEMLSKATGEDESSSATRVWCAIECMRKVGLPANSPLIFSDSSDDGTVFLTAGHFTILSYRFLSRDDNTPKIFSLLVMNNVYEKVSV